MDDHNVERIAIFGAARKANASGARLARDHFINRAVEQLPWHRLCAIGFEVLNGLKRGKSPTRGKNFHKAAAPWTYRRVMQRIECLASENRVLPVAVDPRGISGTIGATASERCFDVSPAA
jgi:transposase